MFFPLLGGECLVVVEIFFSQSPHLTVADVTNIKRPSYINRINNSRNNLPKECQQKWWWILVTFATLRHPRRGGQYLIEQNCLFYLCMLYGLLIQLSCSRENGPTYVGLSGTCWAQTFKRWTFETLLFCFQISGKQGKRKRLKLGTEWDFTACTLTLTLLHPVSSALSLCLAEIWVNEVKVGLPNF